MQSYCTQVTGSDTIWEPSNSTMQTGCTWTDSNAACSACVVQTVSHTHAALHASPGAPILGCEIASRKCCQSSGEVHNGSKCLQHSVIILAVEIGVWHTDGAGEELLSKRLHDHNSSSDTSIISYT